MSTLILIIIAAMFATNFWRSLGICILLPILYVVFVMGSAIS